MHEKRKLFEMVEAFSTAMFVTRDPTDVLNARPMILAEVDDDGVLWFVTDRGSSKVDDIEEHRKVAVTFQSNNEYVSLSGEAKLESDRSRVEALWNEKWRVWFPEGIDDDRLVLLSFHPEAGTYWDNSGLEGWKYLIKAGRAYLAGERPQPNGDQHASVALNAEHLPDKII